MPGGWDALIITRCENFDCYTVLKSSWPEGNLGSYVMQFKEVVRKLRATSALVALGPEAVS